MTPLGAGHPEVAGVAVAHSTAAPRALVDRVFSAYAPSAIGAPTACRLLAGVDGVNDVYLVTTTSAKWILKVYRAAFPRPARRRGRG